MYVFAFAFCYCLLFFCKLGASYFPVSCIIISDRMIDSLGRQLVSCAISAYIKRVLQSIVNQQH